MNATNRSDGQNIEVNEGGKVGAIVQNAKTVIVQGDPKSPLSEAEVDATLQPYREHLIEQCRFVPLRGIRREQRRERGDPQRGQDDSDDRLRLEQIFVALDTTVTGSPALRALVTPKVRHVVLHGAPGCGKSTFVRFLVLALANCGLGQTKNWLPRLPDWPPSEADLLPIRIELRHFAVWLDNRTPEPCHLWDYVLHELATLGKRHSWTDILPAVEQIARAGAVIFLFDGLDEVPGGRGKLVVRDCIQKFSDEGIGRTCRILVTCRTRSYDADYGGRSLHLFKRKPGAADDGHVGMAFELAPFDEPKKKAFIKAWYDALVTPPDPTESDERSLTRETADDRTEALIVAVCGPRSSKLGEMAGNPLLLTVIAHLHSSQRDLRLPDNRAELFHDLIDLLLTRWAERHRPPSKLNAGPGTDETLSDLLAEPGADGFELPHLLRLVAELAHDHYRGGEWEKLILIPAATLRTKLKEANHDPDSPVRVAWAERVMNFIQYRAGLLNSPDGGSNYDFPHSLLGEYLAAYHLARQRDSSDVVAGKVTRDGNWDEVVRLVAGYHVFVQKETRDALDLVESLCGYAAGKPEMERSALGWRRVVLAAEILHEMGPARWERERRQGPQCCVLVRGLLQDLVGMGALPPRDRHRASVMLASLGDWRPGVRLKNGLLSVEDFLELPPGEFRLVSNKREAVINQAFRLARYPITVEQYAAFVTAGGYEDDGSAAATKRLLAWWGEAGLKWKRRNPIVAPEDYDPVFQTPNHPRVGVSWYEATAFCAWLTEVLRERKDIEATDRISLPSEAKWEWAARWNEETRVADDRRYPWSADDEKDLAERCNMSRTSLGHTSAVGLFPAGKADCGAMDLSGNVLEWCKDWYDQDEDARVLRGGSWRVVHSEDLSSGFRVSGLPGTRRDFGGFRCVWVARSAR